MASLKEDPSTVICVSVRKSTKEKMKAVAEEFDISMSALYKNALNFYLKKLELGKRVD